MRCYVVMGVSGSGKTTIGQAIADRIGATFIDGDDLHPNHNIAKMARGEALSDEDRAPWLDKVGHALAQTEGSCLIGCSALKRIYRDRITRAAGEPVAFLFLQGSRVVLQDRMNSRTGHFMPSSLLDSQLATLEPPGGDEHVVTVDIDQPIYAVVDAFVEAITGASPAS